MKFTVVLAVVCLMILEASSNPTPPVLVEEVTSERRVTSTVAQSTAAPVQVVQHSNDPSLVLSDPIDSATKLLIDLDEHVQQYLPSESASSTPEPTTVEPQIYSGGDGELDLALARQDNNQQVSTLLEQLDSLQNRITETINQLMARRRYVLSAMLRPMVTYVRRVRQNLERLQNRLNSLQSAATSSTALNNPSNNVAATVVDQGVIDNIRRRIDDIQKRITDIVGRIGSAFSLPGSAPQNSPTASSGR